MAQSQLFGVVILDGEGERVAVQYAVGAAADDCPAALRTFEGQIRFEAQLLQKVARSVARNEAEVLALDQYLVVFRPSNDVNVFVVGPPEENELLLAEVANGVFGALCIVNGGGAQLSRRALVENLDSTYLVLDEVMDGGMIFEINPAVIAGRVQMQDRPPAADSAPSDAALFNQALVSARDGILRSFLSAT